ncbi:DUF1963 domain-containing protein [Nocardioides perillae]|uniref:DUF1963 domain-containing protein n=1 Tax=Nocardioides perillae TaxID=1119534 RepID=A0A7Y9UL15_9ACTN|nr:hypothetical protein [Nocardioides perillae]
MSASQARSLIEQWHAYIAVEQTLSDREADRRSAELTEKTAELLAAGGADRRALLDAFAGEDGLAGAIGTALLPPPARRVLDPDGFRRHPEVAFEATELPLSTALCLPVADEMVDHDGFRADPLAWTGSWFAGSPAVARTERTTFRWPTRHDGHPLTFVAQVDLAAESANQGFEEYGTTGLPDDGVLQFFHDLETYGDDDDTDPSAWAVRWMPPFMPDELVVADPPKGMDPLPAVPINAQTNLTAPDLDDTRRRSWPAADVERYDRARDWLELSAAEANMMASSPGTALTPWHDEFVPPTEVSRLGGHPFTATTPRLHEVLHKHLPLSSGDRHTLLLDLNPLQLDAHVPASEQWFHGGGHLEVWIGANALATRDFDSCWSFIRTG